MTLFEKLKDIIGLGWSVRFSSFAFQFEIEVSHEDVNGSVVSRTSCMPMQDHFYEERIVDCIKWSMEQISEERDKVQIHQQ